MCIAILNIGKKITDSQLVNCWNANPHGAGIISVQNNKIVIYKEMTNVKDYINEYKRIYSTFGGPIVLHFRIKTHGLTSIDNCHPFSVNDKLAFVHNGMIDNVEMCSVKSDTRIFNETILQKLPNDFIYNEAMIDLISNYIGYSKLIFLNNECEYLIVNEDLGNWEDCGNWYSNNSHKGVTKKQPTNNQWYFNKSNYFDKNECESCGKITEDVKYISDIASHCCNECANYFSSPKKYKQDEYLF
jgi:uncharacterized protein YehS (DUF1456 family)